MDAMEHLLPLTKAVHGKHQKVHMVGARCSTAGHSQTQTKPPAKAMYRTSHANGTVMIISVSLLQIAGHIPRQAIAQRKKDQVAIRAHGTQQQAAVMKLHATHLMVMRQDAAIRAIANGPHPIAMIMAAGIMLIQQRA